MDVQTSKAAIASAVEELLATDPSCFLVEATIKPVNIIKVFIDGDQGVSINKCAALSRALYKKIEEAGWFLPGDFSLEVSSPGITNPLTMLRQYHKNIGRQVEVVQHDSSILLGLLTAVTDAHITLKIQEGKGTKAIQKEIDVLFNNIKTTTVQIQF